MTIEGAMAAVKEKGYSLVQRDRQFYIEPVDESNSQMMHHMIELREPMVSALLFMEYIVEWCGSDRKRWGMLRDLVRANYEDPYGRTPRGTLLTWFGNKASYWNGVALSSKADISFFGRVSDKVGELVPESLVRDGEIAGLLSKKVGL
jgi:hypothetical protein